MKRLKVENKVPWLEACLQTLQDETTKDRTHQRKE
jgi:hypothetical protein